MPCFWAFYRFVGAGWAFVAILLTVAPNPPITFAVFAAITCVVIAKGDKAFLEE